MSNTQEVIDKLKTISIKLQKQVKDLNDTFDSVIPMAESMGFTIDRKTGEIKKI